MTDACSSIQITVGGHSELGAPALLKAIWWGMCLASLLMHLFCLFVVLFVLCLFWTVTDFSEAEKDRGVKFCMRVDLLSRQVFSYFGGQLGQSHQGQKSA